MERFAQGKMMRKIIHIDMDAFFAAVEQRENPEYAGKPIIVGGMPDKRGVVATCSYEARKYGIHSAMPSALAIKLCPKAIFLRPRFDLYKKISLQIREIFNKYTHKIEVVSIDEAYLDVTENKLNEKSATVLAKMIKKEIFNKTHLTASAGVSYNKFLAKIASEMKKPDGLFVIPPDKAEIILENLKIEKFHGIGKVTAQKMKKLGIFTGKDLKKRELAELVRLFGKVGEFYYNVVRGIDNREVKNSTKRKSYGKESTFTRDLSDLPEMLDYLKKTTKTICQGLKNRKNKIKTVSVKIKYSDFQTVIRSKTLMDFTNDFEAIFPVVKNLFLNNVIEDKKIRLLGVSVSNFLKKYRYYQLVLPFDKEVGYYVR
jgi:DNA polymerase-4